MTTRNHSILAGRAGILVVALALLALPACGKKGPDGDSPAAVGAKDALADRPAIGSATPKVDVLAFIGYECQFCRNSSAELLALADANAAQMRVRFLNLPLDVHEHSVDAAKGAVAAQNQGAWRKYYEKMMAAGAVSRDTAIAWAVETNLDAQRFKKDMDSPETAAQIAADVALAGAFGVTGTPSYLVNGHLFQGVQSAEKWKQTIAEEITRADALIAAGTKADTVVTSLVATNAPDRAPAWVKHIVGGEKAPDMPVPAEVKRRSGVGSVTSNSAGAGTAGIQYNQPVRLGPESTDDKTVWKVAVRADDPRQGPEYAQVTMVLFEEFQCPFCKKLQPTIAALRAKYGDKLRVYFKHNPLPFHAQAMNAAEAAEAARTQGKFWQLHDLLFAGQDTLDPKMIRGQAEKIGLDLAAYDNALASHGAAARIQADVEQAAALGARGTPNIFINGRRLVGAKELPVLEALVDEELAKADAQVAAGTKLADLYDKQIAEGKLLDSLDSKTVTIDTKGAPSRGPDAGAIEIVTFQDLQCPFSARLDPHIRAIEKEFEGRVRVQWIDFPLSDIHPNAQLAAEAGKEAAAQGRFWEFHEVVMADQEKLDADGLVARGKKAGLDAGKLKAALKSHKWQATVQADRKKGDDLGVKGTPTVYLNGHKFEPQLGFSANTFRSAVRRLLGTR